ncbi:MAG: exodeoxyribonuclease VII small subunit [Pusillimonas sp.]|mgnify:CR=1 FL=1|jgi:exodeoxyribonuclease VII small subunit|nr:exodeoxyribonuclease VII small subunit [Pusillimonas sp.]|tara:strand:- start:140 stop:424 length:285 start_codon:yes stop_codon:yes gene_type:complete
MAEKQKTSSASEPKGAASLPDDFETALTQLETLVAQMEDGDLPLEQSLAAYERGVALAKRCQSLLDDAEQQVKVLQGNLLKPLDADTASDENQS